jgi:hypothetical protein
MTHPNRNLPDSGEGTGGQDRRTFLKRSSVAISAAALAGCAPQTDSGGADATAADRLHEALLHALAEVVLPGELGAEGRRQAVVAFQAWAYAYEPVAELNHGYGTSLVRYSPADPVPGWQAQLEALDLESRARVGTGFADMAPAGRAELVRHGLTDQGGTLPDPLQARHVAVALLAHWSASPQAVDLCYGRLVSPRTCRGIAETSALPGALS